MVTQWEGALLQRRMDHMVRQLQKEKNKISEIDKHYLIKYTFQFTTLELHP